MLNSDLKIVILNPHQYDEWNSFVDLSPQGCIFCYSWWLDAITKSHFKIIIAIEKSEIVAGMPFAYDAQNKINEPPLTRTLGILYRQQLYLSEHKRLSNQRKWLHALVETIDLDEFVQICTHHNFTDWLPFRWKGLKQTTRYTYLVYYHGKTLNDLWKNLTTGRKYSINKALNNNIKVEESDDLMLLYQFITMSYDRQGLKLRFKLEDLQVLDKAVKKYGNSLILKAVDNSGRTHSVIYSVSIKKTAYILLSGSDPNYRKMGGHTLVFWETIKYYLDKVEYCNFMGSDIKSIEEHLRGFGGEMTPYFHIYNDRLLHGTDFNYHLKEISIHVNGLWNAARNKFARN